jgi:dipeptidyl aminopeptidase/acylaminoacyl peptidase
MNASRWIGVCLVWGILLPESTVPAAEPSAPDSRGGDSRSAPASQDGVAPAGDAAALAAELRGKGWIAFSASTGQGDWDLSVMRPDGSRRRKITDTREYSEAGVRFSPDGRRILYYRMPSTVAIDNNDYGKHELVIAEADGSRAASYGNGFSWASWGPDGTQLACLSKNGIQIVDLESRKVVRQLPRNGVVEQLVWSPDGKWLVGTANGLGPYWNIGRVDATTGAVNAVSETERYNCTPDWMPDGQRIAYARGIIPQQGGWAELWVGNGDGREKCMRYAEEGRHVYGTCPSPDGKYLVFTRSEKDLGGADGAGTQLTIIRWVDTPMVGGTSEKLRKQYPEARRGPRLDLSWGWEPHWTYAELPARPQQKGVGVDER